jgi:hypothetical protein
MSRLQPRQRAAVRWVNAVLGLTLAVLVETKCPFQLLLDGEVFTLDLPSSASFADVDALAEAYALVLPIERSSGAGCEAAPNPRTCLSDAVRRQISYTYGLCSKLAALGAPPPAEAGEPLLLCALSGGVTNQEMQVEACVQLARILRRALVVPRPRPVARSTYAGLDERDAPFGTLWDLAHFERYCQRMGVRLVDAAAPGEARQPTLRAEIFRYGSAPTWRFHRLHANGTTAATLTMSPPPLERGPANEGALLGVLHDEPVVLAPSPFQALSATLGLSCCIAAGHLIARADTIAAALPAGFDCVHARIEEDWFLHACGAGFERQPEFGESSDDAEWTCPSDGRPDGHQRFLRAEHIASALAQASPPVPPGGALYVASGASRAQLAPFAARFDVRTRPPPLPPADDGDVHGAARGVFMSFADALVDRHVCVRARRFFGAQGSTFALKISKLRGEFEAAIWYDQYLIHGAWRKLGEKDERRRDVDGALYTRTEFLAYYGTDAGELRWAQSLG